MAEPIFSEREGFAPQKDPQAHDYLPPWVREAITNEIRDSVQEGAILGVPRVDVYPLFRPYIWKVLNRQPPNSPVGGSFHYYIPAVLAQCSWYEFYDILEGISQLSGLRFGRTDLGELLERINAILARGGIPWKLEQDKVIRALNAQIAERINEARVLLTDPRFKGPDEQFAKAIDHLNRRPDPDEENCVKDAVGALEAVANIIAETHGKQLNYVLREEPFLSGVHPIIRQAIEKIYAYRGAAPGAAHGQVGSAMVTSEEAIWVLATSAATIIYFAHKFSPPAS